MKTTLVKLANEVPMYLRSVLDACVSYTETLEDGKLELDLVIAPGDRLYVSCDDNQVYYEIAHDHIRKMCALMPHQRKAVQ